MFDIRPGDTVRRYDAYDYMRVERVYHGQAACAYLDNPDLVTEILTSNLVHVPQRMTEERALDVLAFLRKHGASAQMRANVFEDYAGRCIIEG